MADWRHDPDKRAAFLAGLHDLYNFYAEHPEFPLPYETTTTGSTFSVGCHYGGEDFAETVHALGGRREKKVDNNYARMVRTFGPGVSLEVWANRDDVCERRQVGVQTVVKPVWHDGDGGTSFSPPDPIGGETVEEPIYEWECRPVLADAEAAG